MPPLRFALYAFTIFSQAVTCMLEWERGNNHIDPDKYSSCFCCSSRCSEKLINPQATNVEAVKIAHVARLHA